MYPISISWYHLPALIPPMTIFLFPPYGGLPLTPNTFGCYTSSWTKTHLSRSSHPGLSSSQMNFLFTLSASFFSSGSCMGLMFSFLSISRSSFMTSLNYVVRDALFRVNTLTASVSLDTMSLLAISTIARWSSASPISCISLDKWNPASPLATFVSSKRSW